MNENNGNGNGSLNGNGHSEKVFSIERKEDIVLAKVAPAARRECCRDTDLTEGARMFFCYLVDAALTFGIYIRRGILKLSDGDLAKDFKVNPKTIRNWKTALAASGRIWITERWNKNSFPTTVYNITALVGQPELPLEAESRNGDLVQHVTFANSNRHPGRFLDRSSSGKFKCRAHGESNCPICKKRGRGGFEVKPPEEAKRQELTANKGPEEKILPRSEATDCRAPRQQIAAPHGKNLPTPSANRCRSGGEDIAVAHGKNLPLPTANGCRGEGKTIADNGKAGDVRVRLSEATFKRSTGLNARNGSGGAKKLNAEKLFLMDVGAMMESWKKGSSKTEMANWGGSWTNKYREDPDLAQRVLADICGMIRERKIKQSPAAAAMDLWKRLPKQKAAARAAAR